jgi:hypothetical protein
MEEISIITIEIEELSQKMMPLKKNSQIEEP